eukprot:Opistho-2@59774
MKLFKSLGGGSKAAATPSGKDAGAGGLDSSLYEDIREKDLPKIHKAAWAGNGTELAALLKKGDPNQADARGRTALMLASIRGHTDCVNQLLKKGAIHAQDMNKHTPMMKAVMGGHISVIQSLLASEVAGNERDVDGATGLIHAIVGGKFDIARLLVEQKSGLNGTDKHGNNALHICVKDNMPDLAKSIISAGIDVNAKNKESLTPLMLAAGACRMDMVEILLGAGANPAEKDGSGFTAVDHAFMRNLEFGNKLSERIDGRGDDDGADDDGSDGPHYAKPAPPAARGQPPKGAAMQPTLAGKTVSGKPDFLSNLLAQEYSDEDESADSRRDGSSARDPPPRGGQKANAPAQQKQLPQKQVAPTEPSKKKLPWERFSDEEDETDRTDRTRTESERSPFPARGKGSGSGTAAPAQPKGAVESKKAAPANSAGNAGQNSSVSQPQRKKLPWEHYDDAGDDESDQTERTESESPAKQPLDRRGAEQATQARGAASGVSGAASGVASGAAGKGASTPSADLGRRPDSARSGRSAATDGIDEDSDDFDMSGDDILHSDDDAGYAPTSRAAPVARAAAADHRDSLGAPKGVEKPPATSNAAAAATGTAGGGGGVEPDRDVSRDRLDKPVSSAPPIPDRVMSADKSSDKSIPTVAKGSAVTPSAAAPASSAPRADGSLQPPSVKPKQFFEPTVDRGEISDSFDSGDESDGPVALTPEVSVGLEAIAKAKQSLANQAQQFKPPSTPQAAGSTSAGSGSATKTAAAPTPSVVKAAADDKRGLGLNYGGHSDEEFGSEGLNDSNDSFNMPDDGDDDALSSLSRSRQQQKRAPSTVTEPVARTTNAPAPQTATSAAKTAAAPTTPAAKTAAAPTTSAAATKSLAPPARGGKSAPERDEESPSLWDSSDDGDDPPPVYGAAAKTSFGASAQKPAQAHPGGAGPRYSDILAANDELLGRTGASLSSEDLPSKAKAGASSDANVKRSSAPASQSQTRKEDRDKSQGEVSFGSDDDFDDDDGSDNAYLASVPSAKGGEPPKSASSKPVAAANPPERPQRIESLQPVGGEANTKLLPRESTGKNGGAVTDPLALRRGQSVEGRAVNVHAPLSTPAHATPLSPALGLAGSDTDLSRAKSPRLAPLALAGMSPCDAHSPDPFSRSSPLPIQSPPGLASALVRASPVARDLPPLAKSPSPVLASALPMYSALI